MDCPVCCGRSEVAQENVGEHVLRQRRCEDCGNEWFSVELEISAAAISYQQVGLEEQPVFRLRVPARDAILGN